MGEDHHGELVFIPQITITPTGNLTEFAFVLHHRQFPVCLAFVMTINKAIWPPRISRPMAMSSLDAPHLHSVSTMVIRWICLTVQE